MSYFETKSLLSNRVSIIPQVHTTNVKYPCTGFCYMAIQDSDVLINLYLANEQVEYKEYVKSLIIKAGERKKNNPLIDPRGEFINQETVQKDFPEIYAKLIFNEFGVVGKEELEIVTNNLFLELLEIKEGGCVLVNRSEETFVMFKLDQHNFLVVDSHQPVHGTVNIENAVKYIMRNGHVRGTVQIGTM